jgi:hypothetical protein
VLGRLYYFSGLQTHIAVVSVDLSSIDPSSAAREHVANVIRRVLDAGASDLHWVCEDAIAPTAEALIEARILPGERSLPGILRDGLGFRVSLVFAILKAAPGFIARSASQWAAQAFGHSEKDLPLLPERKTERL